jgi:MFS family permease
VSSIYSRWNGNKKRARKVAFGAMYGALAGAVIGYPLGYFVVPILQFQAEALHDPYTSGAVFAWMGVVGGFFIGGRLADAKYRKERRAAYRAARK